MKKFMLFCLVLIFALSAIGCFEKEIDNFRHPITVKENCIANIGKDTLSQAVDLS